MANRASCAVPLSTGTTAAETVTGVLHTPVTKTSTLSQGLESRMAPPCGSTRDSRLRLPQAGDGVDGEVLVVNVLARRAPTTPIAAGHFLGLHETAHAIGL